MKKQSKKNIPVNNYIKLGIIVVVTIFAVVVLRNWYVGKTNYELNIPIIKDTLVNEVNTDEIYNYIRENENAILYVGVVSNKNCRSFEQEFNQVIVDRNLQYTITYLNISKTSSKSKFIKEFNKFYDTNILGYPSLVIFEEGSVKDIITVKTGKDLNIDDVINFLDYNDVEADSL